ncbi:Glucose-1-phosphatase precursor [Mycoplasmopsis maculosa]|uniref:Glucose-1-phosphatase n=1 Tax=Mycoplasmopsis maculosa TaxID=114885 RepID=A0A449B3I6_9BACT|nr:histidine-type phosphatase [Mycoplasmopsis maculosa]VEU75129.1 Glucose-1-phosphatase precursor [Mycoplasmopsis maculosa]
MKKIIFSRHGIRYPFFTKERSIKAFNKDLMQWEYKNPELVLLTEKCERAEFAFGQFLRNYLNLSGRESFIAKANSTYRTFETAQLLSLGLFPHIKNNVIVSDENLKSEDPYFSLNYTDKKYINSNILADIDLKNKELYSLVEERFNLEKGILLNKKTEFNIIEGLERNYPTGPLGICSTFSDLLQVKYFLNFDTDKIIPNSKNFLNDLKIISKAKDQIIDLVYANKKLLEESEKNVIKLLKNEFNNDKELTLLVGHDTNIASILSYLEIELDSNRDVIEKYPIGSKLIFNIRDNKTFDLEYTYFKYEDIRNNKFDNPVILSLGKNLKL